MKQQGLYTNSGPKSQGMNVKKRSVINSNLFVHSTSSKQLPKQTYLDSSRTIEACIYYKAHILECPRLWQITMIY